MNARALAALVARALVALAALSALVTASASAATTAPVAPVEPATDAYFGTTVVDPYRWMERGPSDPRFVPYLKAEGAYTASLLAPLAKPHDALRAKLLALSAGVARVSGWQQAGGRLFYEELEPNASVSVLRVRDANGASRVLFDPATLADAKSHAAIDYYAPSADGSHVAVGVSLGGSENDSIRVLDARSGRMLPDTISRAVYGSPSWREDGSSFYYSRLPARALGPDGRIAVFDDQRVYVHVLGRDPEQDTPVFGPGIVAAIPAAGFNSVSAVPGQPYALASHSAGTTDPGMYYVARAGSAAWTLLIAPEDHLATGGSSPLAVRGTRVYALLQNVPNGRIVAYDLAHPEAKPVTVVAESAKVIEGVFASSDGLFVEYRDGLHFGITKIDESGAALGDVALPYAGSVLAIDASPTEPGLRFGLASWTRSPALFTYDAASGRVADTGAIARDPADVSHIVAREVTAPSTDGASVPISIIARDDIALDGSHPTLFEGYGAYGIAIDPAFSPSALEWVRRGGVLAFAHVRGGGEYGERWHLAGVKATKRHTVDDMIATARYLIANRYTSPAHLAVRGTSAGGIAVGGALVAHPELFAAAVDNVGVTNLLRFQQTVGGPANVPEFGDVAKAADFAFIYPMDAYGHVKDGTAYPAVLGITGINDPRVPPWIVAKFVARVRAATASGKPVALRVDFDAGHGIGSSRTQAIDARADEWTFLLWQLGDPEFQPS